MKSFVPSDRYGIAFGRFAHENPNEDWTTVDAVTWYIEQLRQQWDIAVVREINHEAIKQRLDKSWYNWFIKFPSDGVEVEFLLRYT